MTPEEFTFNRLKERAPEIYEYGTKFWYNENGELHRDNDLPAIIFNDGEQWWYKNSVRCRENGPARIKADGTKTDWFKNGVQIK